MCHTQVCRIVWMCTHVNVVNTCVNVVSTCAFCLRTELHTHSVYWVDLEVAVHSSSFGCSHREGRLWPGNGERPRCTWSCPMSLYFPGSVGCGPNGCTLLCPWSLPARGWSGCGPCDPWSARSGSLYSSVCSCALSLADTHYRLPCPGQWLLYRTFRALGLPDLLSILLPCSAKLWP